jgi:hypothetical protein
MMMSDSSYEFELRTYTRQRGQLPPAALLYLDGACHVAAHGGAEERRLLECGALHLAMIHFDSPGPLRRASRPLARLNAADAAGSLGWGSARS